MTERDDQPQRSRDEEPVGWGDERDEGGGGRDDRDRDLERLLAERPPHHDSD